MVLRLTFVNETTLDVLTYGFFFDRVGEGFGTIWVGTSTYDARPFTGVRKVETVER